MRPGGGLVCVSPDYFGPHISACSMVNGRLFTYVRNKSVNTKRYTENEFTEGRDVV